MGFAHFEDYFENPHYEHRSACKCSFLRIFDDIEFKPTGKRSK